MRRCILRIADHTDTVDCGEVAGSHGYCPEHFRWIVQDKRGRVSLFAAQYKDEHDKLVKLLQMEDADVKGREQAAAEANLGGGI